ncbi:dynamin family protein [Aquibacillus sediminis]|uniref:dynamin family protein n=1 Tax=Aquibacillus sediminis TaxID=2574734 RepID=UPI0011082446|nr:dynamin family protein [Aquibacillus sediminis]
MQSSVSVQVDPDNLAAIYNEFIEDSNYSGAQKVLDLLAKMDQDEFVVCFSGHFSAGKSTMINALIGEEILPQSPIPTSANVVKLKAGEGYARIFFKEEVPLELKEPYQIDQIQSYCKDGDAIQSVEISKKTTMIPKNVTIMDTPGIDSVDDADRVMTESSLHLVDVLFYVMDYNHVQSEVNLKFIKKMQDQGKPIYIIINMIDKHNEQELPFDSFKASIGQTFSNWDILPNQIYFTSLIEKRHRLNQFNRVQQDLTTIMANKQERLDQTIYDSLGVLLEQHISGVQQQNQEKVERLQEELNRLEAKTDQSSDHDLEYQLQFYENINNEAEQVFTSMINTTLKNAYIMPFEIREKAEQYLESQAKGFRVGLLSTKKKIQQERLNRLDAFYHALMQKVKATIEWKLREKALAFLETFYINHSEHVQRLQSFNVEYPKERIEALIKPGAKQSGEYLLVYTEDIANDIKQFYKQEMRTIWDALQPSILAEKERQVRLLSEQLEQNNAGERIKKELAELDSFIQNKHRDLMMLRSSTVDASNQVTELRERIHQSTPVFRTEVTATESIPTQSKTSSQDKETIEPKQTQVTKKQYHVEDITKRLDQTAGLLQQLIGFHSIYDDLKQKKDRIKNRSFTVALFGAFSAGKSSFANALIGKSVLPVSPNPTTAAINKICPPNDEHHHEQVVVTFKSEERILEDIHALIEDKQFQSLQQCLHTFQADKKQFDRKQQLFISSLEQGYEQLSEHLGKQLTIHLDQLADYVANEALASYVESTELYYACPITDQGITLVDTPGADSINARHTEVTFQYIKQADAILFVTYYNHAFSKADRDFLIQLGRVKDAFQLDKMFFLVNAADLAKDQTEVDLVTNYVADQLQNFGIRNPRMYPISSKLALKNKMEATNYASGIQSFEKDFYSFINQELLDILVKASLHDIDRAKQQLKRYIDTASMSNDDKQKQQEVYQSRLEQVRHEINQYNSEKFQNDIKQKTEKQLYYVDQRIFMQFQDYFKETFNPSTIKNNGKQGKTEIEQALKQLIKNIGYQLEQELRAVSLRLEAFLDQKQIDLNKVWEQQSSKIESDLSLPDVEHDEYDTPIFEEALKSVSMREFDPAIQVFKNTKAFFEKDEKKQMMEKIKEIAAPHIQAYLSMNTDYLISYYLEQWEQAVTRNCNKTIRSVEQYYEGLMYSLTEQTDVGELEAILAEIESVN